MHAAGPVRHPVVYPVVRQRSKMLARVLSRLPMALGLRELSIPAVISCAMVMVDAARLPLVVAQRRAPVGALYPNSRPPQGTPVMLR